MNNTRRDSRNTISAIILIGVGALFLLAQIFQFNVFSLLAGSWPLFIILPGVAFLAAAWMGGKNTAALAIPGAIITGTGVMIGAMDATRHWEAWAYAWALYPVFVGLGLLFMGSRTGNAENTRTGRAAVRWGLMVFVVLAVLFELLIFGGGLEIGSWLVPAVLVVIGVLMLRGGLPVFGAEKRKNAPLFTGAAVVNGKRKTGDTGINPNLQRRIDEAIAEPDDPDAPQGV